MEKLIFQSSKSELLHHGNGDVLPKISFHERIAPSNEIKVRGKEKEARRIHDHAANKSLITRDVCIATSLITKYAKCGMHEKALEIFNELPVRNTVTWNALLCGYAQNGLGEEALKCLRLMRDAGVCPDEVTYTCTLKACGLLGSLEIGEEIDVEIREQGLLHEDVMLANALVDMYSKCGALERARNVFDQLHVRNVVTWSALIGGYARHGFGEEALKCFRHMNDARIRPNAVTYVCVLNACGIVGSLEIGKYIDAEVRKQGLLWNNVLLGTALVDMYSKCGALKNAREIFEKLSVRNIVSWSALIGGYVQHGLGEDALKCFKQMNDARVRPNGVTYVCILKACGIVGSLEIGEAIHAELRKQGLLEKDVVLGNALIDMYSKCGVPEKAQEVFNQLLVRNVVSWSTLINGHAQLGQTNVVLNLYRQMIAEGIVPNSVTFIVLLTACSHAGLMEEGEQLFHEMRAAYCLEPILEHYTCMIDLFGRAGHFDKMKTLIDKVSNSRYLPLFLTVLGACRKWRNVRLGRWAFEQAIGLDERCSAAYVCMKNIYARAGMQMEADEVESQRVENKASMIPGCSWWSDMSRNVHSFVAGDESHPQTTHIYAKLEEIHMKLAREGYSPGLHCLSRLLPCEDNEHDLCGYSENLALACALINSPKGAPLRVTKNMKMCEECHSSTTLISVFEKCRIQVNDPDRVHIFENGRCICEDTYDVELSSYGFRQFSYA